MSYVFENDLKEDIADKMKEIIQVIGPELEDAASDILHLIVCEGIYLHNPENIVK